MDQFLKLDPSEFYRIHHKLEFAESLLQGIAASTQELLTSQNFQASVQSALAILGRATQVDRTYIFKQHLNQENIPLMSQCWEWVAQGITPEIDNPDLQNLPFSEIFPRWYHTINQGKSIAGLVKDFPTSEKAILEPQHILSIVVVPIKVNQSIWGFMGFDDCHRNRIWSSSEIFVLTTVANAFGGAIAHHSTEQQLREANQELLTKQFNLTQEKTRADLASQSKKLFLNNISHELKTPLNGIFGYLKILNQSPNLDAEQILGLTKIQESASHLNLLVSNLLDVTELESKTLTLSIKKINFSDLIDDIEGIAYALCEAKNLAYETITSPQIPKYIWTDKIRLKQVLLNLINNAIKFTPKGSVKLKILKIPSPKAFDNDAYNKDLDRQAYRFIIEDTGIGIAETEQQKLFALFSKVKNQRNQAEGSGLGLYISQKIVNALESELKLNSIHGMGSEFFFDLMLKSHQSINRSRPPSIDLGQLSSQQAIHQEFNRESHIIPAKEELGFLLRLTQIGQVKKVLTSLERIKCETPGTYRFCTDLISLAKRFDLEGMEQYLSMAMNRTQPGINDELAS